MTILNEQELLTNITTNATEISLIGAWKKVASIIEEL